MGVPPDQWAAPDAPVGAGALTEQPPAHAVGEPVHVYGPPPSNPPAGYGSSPQSPPPSGPPGAYADPPPSPPPPGSPAPYADPPALHADSPAPYPGSPPPPVPPRRPRPVRSRAHRRPKRRRPVRRIVLVLLAALLLTPAGTYGWADTKLNRGVDLDKFGQRPPQGAGTNYLIVGSDSREGLSDRDRKNLHTGIAGGRRTDSMILLHTGAHGTSMVSLPRDSWVTVPPYTRPTTGKRSGPVKNKLNAAFSQGGPELLARTVEHNTGVRIDHYAEIGFAGFVNIVDAVGGVRMCLDRDVRDEKSGADLRKGCQTLDGAQALAFVRQRHQEADGDLGRTQNQQKFLSALAHQAAKPHTVLDPSSLYPTLDAGLDTLVVDRNMGLRDLTTMARAVQGVSGGQGQRVNVPVSTTGYRTPKGSAALWDAERARPLFDELRHDRPVTVRGK